MPLSSISYILLWLKSFMLAFLLVSLELGLAVLFLELFGLPFRRGFFCDDATIRYPYHESTISQGLLVLCCLLTPLVIVSCSDIWTHGLLTKSRYFVFRKQIPQWLTSTFTTLGVFLLGLGFAQIVCEVGKFITGRLRPHFIAVCLPDIDCNSTSNLNRYIEDYTCDGDVDAVIRARLSFPSSHATLSFYTAFFLIIYLQRSKKWSTLRLLVPGVQFLLFITAVYTALSRIRDYWHHWTDVLAGAVLGTAFAFLMICCASDLEFTSMTETEDGLVPLNKTTSTSYIPTEEQNT